MRPRKNTHSALKTNIKILNNQSQSDRPRLLTTDYVSVAGSLVLCFDFNCETGLEFHGEVVGKDRNLLDELFDQSLIELCDVGFLPGYEVLQFLDPIHGLFPVVAVHLGLFLLFPEPENFIGDGIVVLFAVGLLYELFLQIFQPCLNSIRREGVGSYYGLGDVFLQLLQEDLPLGQNLVDGLDRDFLKKELVDRPVGAVCLSGAGSNRLMQRQTMDLQPWLFQWTRR